MTGLLLGSSSIRHQILNELVDLTKLLLEDSQGKINDPLLGSMLARVIPTEPAVDITPEEMLTYVQEKSQWCKALGTFLDGSVAIKSTGQDIAQAWKKKEASISILLED